MDSGNMLKAPRDDLPPRQTMPPEKLRALMNKTAGNWHVVRYTVPLHSDESEDWRSVRYRVVHGVSLVIAEDLREDDAKLIASVPDLLERLSDAELDNCALKFALEQSKSTIKSWQKNYSEVMEQRDKFAQQLGVVPHDRGDSRSAESTS